MLDRNLVLATAAHMIGVGPEHNRACYLEITEGRADWTVNGVTKHYGWCGDFVSAVLMLCGVTDGTALNRAALNGGKWVPGVNLSRLSDYIAARGGLVTLASARANPDLVRDGDIVIFARPDGDHIAFKESWLAAGEFQSIDGNSWGRVVKRNARHLVARQGEMPVRHFLNIDVLPIGGTITHKLGGEPDQSDLSPETVAMGGDGGMLLNPGRLI